MHISDDYIPFSVIKGKGKNLEKFAFDEMGGERMREGLS